jgi:hypothetical protein
MREGVVPYKQPLYSQYSVQLLLNDLTTGLSNRRGLSLIKSHKKANWWTSSSKQTTGIKRERGDSFYTSSR